MSFSQVDVAALLQDGTHLAICGDLTGEEGKMLESAEIFFVVHQGASVVRGRGTFRAGQNEWGACADLTGQPLRVGEAVAMGLVVVERSNPVGFTTLTWMQDISIKDGLPAGRIDPCLGQRVSPTV